MIVYATGKPSYLEFHLAQDQRAIPEHSTIYAIFDGKRCVDSLDEYTFRAMTDGEYYELQACVNLARGLEAKRRHHLRNRNLFYSVLRWFDSRLRTSRAKPRFE